MCVRSGKTLLYPKAKGSIPLEAPPPLVAVSASLPKEGGREDRLINNLYWCVLVVVSLLGYNITEEE